MAQALYISEIHMDLNEYTRMAMKVTEKSRRADHHDRGSNLDRGRSGGFRLEAV